MLLEPSKPPLDHVALGVTRTIQPPWPFSVGSGGDDSLESPCSHMSEERIAVVRAIADNGLPLACRDEKGSLRHVVHLTSRQEVTHKLATFGHESMKLCSESSPRPAKSFRGVATCFSRTCRVRMSLHDCAVDQQKLAIVASGEKLTELFPSLGKRPS